MEPPTCLPVGSWGTGFHHRRLSGLWSDDAFPGQTWQGAYPIEAVGRTHDARAESGVQPDLWIFRRPWLGVRRLRGHQARRHRGGARPVWLGRWPGHLLVFRPQGGDGHHPDDSVRLDVPQSTERLFLDPGLPGDRRLTKIQAQDCSRLFYATSSDALIASKRIPTTLGSRIASFSSDVCEFIRVGNDANRLNLPLLHINSEDGECFFA